MTGGFDPFPYRGNKFVLNMGPNVKFVSAITDAFSNKKMGVNFFPQKRPNGGRGGPREVW